MITIGGLVFLMACVFGSYIVSGGSIGVLGEALPFEFTTIGGAGVFQRVDRVRHHESTDRGAQDGQHFERQGRHHRADVPAGSSKAAEHTGEHEYQSADR